MKLETVRRVLGWVAWLGVIVAMVLILTGAQSRPIKPDGPEIMVYRIKMEDGSHMRCAVVDWRFMVALDCEWPAK